VTEHSNHNTAKLIGKTAQTTTTNSRTNKEKKQESSPMTGSG